MTSALNAARATAPASIGNVGVGFDVLGLAFDAVRDSVTAHREAAPGVRLGKVSGLVETLPAEVNRNCALAAAAAVLEAAGADFGCRIDIHKGVPLSAGMGGSAASAVAAAGAVNALLETPFATLDLLLPAMAGERVSADPPPWDNVMASLLGGLVIAARLDPPLIRRLPLPTGIACILFHPERKIETRRARELLSDTIAKDIAVEHTRHIAGFVAGCASNDRELIASGLRDVFIEPQRLPLLPELAAVQAAASEAGALGCSFSGSGPSVFAWVPEEQAEACGAAMAEAFAAAGCGAKQYHAALICDGLRLEPMA
ncbi:homoserine kinase [Maricaulis sp.]|uniref:homoserine kinase n=1 Tax=Maricaulis sp. TaxID=1486257 RepID=UPI003A90DCD3